jgi:hypothetical protein
MDIYAPIQNKYYKWYLSICQSRQLFSRIKIKGSGFSDHHIIPDSFYIESKRKGPKDGWLFGDPDESGNIVRLNQKEHFLVHKLLTKCYEGLARRKCIFAFHRMVVGNKNSKDYVYAMKIWEENNIGKGNPAWNGGKVTLICEGCFGEYKVKPCIAAARQFCTKKCCNEQHSISLICLECGKQFTKKKSKNTIFCCLICANKAKASDQKKLRKISICKECQKEFGTNCSPSRFAKQDFCGRSCSNKNRYRISRCD